MAFKAIIHLGHQLGLFKLDFLIENRMAFLAAESLILYVELMVESIYLPIGESGDLSVPVLFFVAFITSFCAGNIPSAVCCPARLNILMTILATHTAVDMCLMGKRNFLRVTECAGFGSHLIIMAFETELHRREGTPRPERLVQKTCMAFGTGNILLNMYLVVVCQPIARKGLHKPQILEYVLLMAFSDTGLHIEQVDILGFGAGSCRGMAILALDTHLEMQFMGKDLSPLGIQQCRTTENDEHEGEDVIVQCLHILSCIKRDTSPK